MKIRFFAFLFAIFMLVSCTPAVTPDESVGPEQPQQPQQPEQPEEPEEPEEPEPITLELFKDGKSDYTLVYDDSDDYITAEVMAFLQLLKNDHGVELTAVGASEAEDDYGKEIVVGGVRASSAVVKVQLDDANDFGMCVVEDDWVLLATGRGMYRYMFDVVESRELSRLKNGCMERSSERDFIYHASYLKNRSYMDYTKPSEGYNATNLLNYFEAREFTGKTGKRIVYRLYVPFDYDPDKQYPVLLVLHGAGERGDNNTSQMGHMISQLFNMKNSPVRDAIVVCPQCPEGNQWVDTPWAYGSYSTERVKISDELTTVIEILDELYMEFSLDEDRHYVMGLSMGGFGTWDLLMRYPDFFAAGIPICGGADPAMAEKLVNVPIKTFHGSADSAVPVRGTREMAAALEAAGSTVYTYEEFEGAEHGIWNTVASREDVINWLFAQNMSER